MATDNPWYGYRRIAVMCRQAGARRQRPRGLSRHEAGRATAAASAPPGRAASGRQLFELVPKRPNELWQMDVTYAHIPDHGWWYAVTVIDYFPAICWPVT